MAYLQNNKCDRLMKILLFIAILLGNVLAASAQKALKDVLREMPEHVIPYINDEQRDEISKFTGVNDTVRVKNMLNGFTAVDVSGDDYARIILNESMSLQLKLLDLNDTARIICMVKTVEKPVKESCVSFYSTDWRKLASSFGLPVYGGADELLGAFIQRPDTMPEARFEYLRSCIEPVILNATMKPDENIITFSLSIPFDTKDDGDDEIKAIIKQKSYKWSGDIFKMY